MQNCLSTGYFKDVLTFLGLDYTDALLITLDVIRINFPKIRLIGMINITHKKLLLKG